MHYLSGSSTNTNDVKVIDYSYYFTHKAKYIPVIKPQGIIICALKIDDNYCPACRFKLVHLDLKHRRCMSCYVYIAPPGENLDDVILARSTANLYTADLADPKKDVYIWYREAVDGQKNLFIKQ